MTTAQRYTLIAMILGSGVVFLDGSIVNLALPHIGSDLRAGFTSLQWVVDGYALSLAALILLGGSLGDILGHKRVYLVGLISFACISLLCGLAPSTNTLITLRILQGICGALVVPGALAIINTNFAPAQRGRAIGQWTAWSGIATAIGPLIGGYLIDHASWRWIFLMNLPLIAITIVLAAIGATESRDRRPRHIDWPGAALAAASLAALSYGLIEGPVHHWNTVTLAAVALGLLGAIGFIIFERRQTDPMVELDLFRSANFTAANLATFAMYGALGGFFFALAIYLQQQLHYSSLAAGLSFLPTTVILFLLSSRFGALAGRYGPRRFMTAGPLLAALGILWLSRLHLGSTFIGGVLPGIILFALGLSMTVAPLTITVMTSVPEQASGIASGINNAVSRVAGLLVVAILGLFGPSQVFIFAAYLCATLAAIAGLASWLLVQDKLPA